MQLSLELCWLFAVVVLTLHFAGSGGVPAHQPYFLAIVFALLMVLLNVALGLYGRAGNRSVGGYLWRGLLLAPAIGIPLAYLAALAMPGGESFREHVVVVGVAALGGLFVLRLAIIRPFLAVDGVHRVLVLGTGPEARLVEASLATPVSKGIRLVGFYRLNNSGPTLVAPHRVLAGSAPLEDLLRRLNVDEVIVAVREQRGGVLPLRSLLECRLNGVRITNLAGFFERVHRRVPIDLVKISWLIYGDGYRQDWMRSAIKRTFDVAVASLLLLATLPLMVIVAAAIIIESGRPVIYRQTRVGCRGENFSMFKFRSMAKDAERDNHARWADLNDSRVTSVGRLMRRTRIDELPQLINVIRGEMSFVGPRPERPEFVAMLSEKIPFYAVRHSIKPGLTGWAQVRYSYGATIEQSRDKLEYDLYYVKNHSLALDLRILFETILVVLRGEGAR